MQNRITQGTTACQGQVWTMRMAVCDEVFISWQYGHYAIISYSRYPPTPQKMTTAAMQDMWLQIRPMLNLLCFSWGIFSFVLLSRPNLMKYNAVLFKLSISVGKCV